MAIFSNGQFLALYDTTRADFARLLLLIRGKGFKLTRNRADQWRRHDWNGIDPKTGVTVEVTP